MTIHFGQDIAYEAVDSQVDQLEEPPPKNMPARWMSALALVPLAAIAAVAIVLGAA